MKRPQLIGAVLALACASQACAMGGLADLSVYDRTEARQLQIYWHDGRAYVVGKPGNEYQITLRNRARADLLAVMSVDGVNVITGETADPKQSGYVLGPSRSLEVRGWRKSLAQTAAFYFTALPDSYAARTGRPDDVGVIGVALFRRKQERPEIGQIAPAPQASRGAADSERLGTGHGRRETSYAQYVNFERATNAPAETIAVYYDSYRNLVARGVIRDPIAAPPQHPRPFPGFAPDPQVWTPGPSIGG